MILFALPLLRHPGWCRQSAESIENNINNFKQSNMEDKDLKFLNDCTNEQLQLLVDFIIYDKDGKRRYTEQLSNIDGFEENYPNNIKTLLPYAINELQRFGGNTIFNLVRGHGVSYREILEDVCRKLKVNFNKDNSTELLEQYMLQKFLIMSIDKMTDEDARHLSANLSKEALKQQIGLLKAGSPIFIRLITMLVANMAKSWGLRQAGALVARFAGSRAFAILTGPIGWVLTAIWTAFDVAGAAYRVTIPCTITVAYLRVISDKTEEELDDILK
jgi:uncharacterized protein YaaW (UPF0174 family)